ncbi:unnamed protein product [Phytomonas sp. Hart1]|nr:unnamed protein product [Phytomonas sp. Hart1]|eukprot:CCW65927.1 unnamed protein product [Phytomonas sp. isolate Hart1]
MLCASLRRLSIRLTSEQIEAKIRSSEILKPVLHVAVQDVSAGCGSFFNIQVASPVFEGKSLIQQHRIVNEVLKHEIKKIHGFTLKTAPNLDE